MLLSASLQAGQPVWTLTPSAEFPPIQNVSATETVVVQYLVQNQSHKNHQLQMLPIDGVRASGCETSLSYKQSCLLNLSIDGKAIQGNLVGGPILCQTYRGDPNRNQCYQPSFANRLQITKTNVPIPPGNTVFTTVAAYLNGSGQSLPLSYFSEDGAKTWLASTAFPEPLFFNNEITLRNVSCIAPHACVAVGFYDSSALSSTAPLSYLSQDNGKNWTVSEVFSLPSGSNYELADVSCLPNSRCVAVGNYEQTGSLKKPLSYFSTNLGGSWTLVSVPTLPTEDVMLNGVSCTENGACVAVGTLDPDLPAAYFSTNFGEVWIRSNIAPQGIETQLMGVSCVSSQCAAVGTDNDALPVAYFSSNSGQDWSDSTILSTMNVLLFTSVSCHATGQCVVAGVGFVGSDLITISYVSTDFGQTWALANTQPTPIPIGIGEIIFPHIVCQENGVCAITSTTPIGMPLSYVSTDFGNNWADSSISPIPEAIATVMGGVS